MRALLTACRELAVDYNTLPAIVYVFEHKKTLFHRVRNFIEIGYYKGSNWQQSTEQVTNWTTNDLIH